MSKHSECESATILFPFVGLLNDAWGTRECDYERVSRHSQVERVRRVGTVVSVR